MGDRAIVISWGNPHIGRETMSLGVFTEALTFYQGCKDKKEVEDYHVFFHGTGNFSQDGGFMTVIGSRDQLNELIERDDYQLLVNKAAHVVDNFRITTAETGPAIMQRVEVTQRARKDLGIE